MLRKFKRLIIGVALIAAASSNGYALEGWPNFSGNESVIEIFKPGFTASTDGYQYDIAEQSTLTRAETFLLEGLLRLPKLKLGFNLTALEEIDENRAKYAFHLFQNGKFDVLQVTLVREKIPGAEAQEAVDAEHHNKSISKRDLVDFLTNLWEKVRPIAEDKARELWPQIQDALVNKVVPWLQSNLMPKVEKMAEDVIQQILHRFNGSSSLDEASASSSSLESSTVMTTDEV